MLNLKKQIFLALAIMTFTFTDSAQAFLGVGDIVTDPGMTILTTIKNIKDLAFQGYDKIREYGKDYEDAYYQTMSLAQQLTEIQHAYTQIQNQMSMMKGLDPSNVHKFFASLRELDGQMASVNNRMDGMLDSSAQAIDKFENLYPNFEKMSGLSPEQSKQVIDRSYQAQRDNVKNGKARVAAIYERRAVLNKFIEDKSEANHSTEGMKGAAQMGNDIALQALAENQSIHETQGQILKQAVDNQNNLQMVSQAMQVEASRTFKYTPTPSTIEGPGLYHIQ